MSTITMQVTEPSNPDSPVTITADGPVVVEVTQHRMILVYEPGDDGDLIGCFDPSLPTNASWTETTTTP